MNKILKGFVIKTMITPRFDTENFHQCLDNYKQFSFILLDFFLAYQLRVFKKTHFSHHEKLPAQGIVRKSDF